MSCVWGLEFISFLILYDYIHWKLRIHFISWTCVSANWVICYLWTSRIYCKKRTATVFPLRFFWPACSAVARQLQIWFFGFTSVNFGHVRACNIPLEYKGVENTLSNNVLHAQRTLKLKSQNEKGKIVLVKRPQIRVVKKTATAKRLRFFLFSRNFLLVVIHRSFIST